MDNCNLQVVHSGNTLSSDFFGKLSFVDVPLDSSFFDRIHLCISLDPEFLKNGSFFSEISQFLKGQSENFFHSEFDLIIDKKGGGGCFVHRSTRILGPLYLTGFSYVSPDCVLGPATYLREGTIVGSGCRIGFNSEVKSTVIFDRVTCSHQTYIGHSIVGQNSIIGGGTIIAARRLDDQSVTIDFPHQPTPTQHQKFGALIAKDSKTMIHSLIMPGSVLMKDPETNGV